MKRRHRNENGKKYIGASDDGRLHPGGMGQADIIKNILRHGLHHGQLQNHGKGRTRRLQQPSAAFLPIQQASCQNDHHARQHEAHPGKHDLRHAVSGFDVKQLISDLNAWSGTAP